MSSIVPMKVFYIGGATSFFKDKTLRQAMQMVWHSPELKGLDPLKLVFTGTGKMLFMDRQAFNAYLEGNLTQPELIELTQCDELYRNKKDLVFSESLEVEAGSLWKANRNEVTLIDDDMHITTKLNLTIFEIAQP